MCFLRCSLIICSDVASGLKCLQRDIPCYKGTPQCESQPPTPQKKITKEERERKEKIEKKKEKEPSNLYPHTAPIQEDKENAQFLF
jgi:hypothetical protein